MALTPQIIFINEDYVKAYSHIDGSVDSNDILPSIIQAQDSQIQPLLGTDLYNELKKKVSLNVVEGDYETLLNDYVQMTTLKWTLVHFYPYLNQKIANGTIGSRNVESISPSSLSDVQSMIAIERTNAQFYSERLIEYLQNNGSLFSEYNSNSGADIIPETQTYSEGGLTISGNGGGNKLKNWNCCGR